MSFRYAKVTLFIQLAKEFQENRIFDCTKIVFMCRNKGLFVKKGEVREVYLELLKLSYSYFKLSLT